MLRRLRQIWGRWRWFLRAKPEILFRIGQIQELFWGFAVIIFNLLFRVAPFAILNLSIFS